MIYYLEKFRLLIAKPLFRWGTHPITIFVVLISLIITLIVFWSFWYFDVTTAIQNFKQHIEIKKLDDSASSLIVTGLVFLSLILIGTIFLFFSFQRQKFLNLQQKTFLSSVTHELRSPLASIHLVIDTLNSRTVNEGDQKKLLSIMEKDCVRLSRLVDQVLITSRLDRGLSISEVHEPTFSLHDVCSDVIQSLLHLDASLKERIKIKLGFNENILGNRNIYVVILRNIIENAIKYSPKGTPIIIVAQEHAGMLSLSIEDFGFGVEKRECKKNFSMFYRGKLTHTKAISGTGVGLFIVKSLVESLGGYVWMEPKQDKAGTIIHIKVPIKTMVES